MLTDLFRHRHLLSCYLLHWHLCGTKAKLLTDYALGNRSLPWWVILASILAAEISAATFLGGSGEGTIPATSHTPSSASGTILGRIIVGRLFSQALL